jgi:hypothetical protein
MFGKDPCSSEPRISLDSIDESLDLLDHAQ